MNKKLLYSIFSFLVLAFVSQAQTATIKGLVKDDFNNPVAKAIVSINRQTSTTLENGAFEITNVPYGNYQIEIQIEGFANYVELVNVNSPLVDLITLTVHHNDLQKNNPDEIPTLTLTDDEVDAGNGQNASSALNASRDAFQQAAIFKFSAARFRIRGYDDENFTTLVNGIPTTDLNNGRTMYQAWSGLNDVLRSRETSIGLGATDYTFGGIGANYNIDTKASSQRKQLQVGYALSNRTYDNRLVATYGTGILKGGWAFALSASRRWAQEGYVAGTYTDDFSYFFSAEKIIGKHSISLTRLASENINGRSTPTVQELYDLAGTHYYNPNWGYQNGEKRNAVVGRNSQPLTILSHDWSINDNSSLHSSISYQYGKNSFTGLDWYNAADPRPSYYRNLPSFVSNDMNDPAGAALVTQLLTETEKQRQIQWDLLYDINRHSFDSIKNANGIAGNTVYGNQAAYVVGENVTENKRFNFNAVYNASLTDHISLDIGVNYQSQESNFYKQLNDLLGADFFVDYNNFSDITSNRDSSLLQNDLNNPNRILQVGDRYSYDYTATIKQYGGWAQGNFKYDNIDFFVAAQLSQSSFQRTGHTLNGVFPDDSYGKSVEKKFSNYGLKGGLTYKLNGRNYIYTNGEYLTRSPWFEDVFVSPRTRNEVAKDLGEQQITSAEGGYLLRTPKVKARVAFFYTQFNNDTRTIRYYNDDFQTFVNYTMTNIDKQHMGTELSFETNLGRGFSVNAAASIGRFLYTSRPLVYVTEDNKDTVLANNEIIYAKNYHVGGGPERAYTIGLDYRAKRFWGFFINLNCFDKTYLEFNPVRRTTSAVDQLDENDPQREAILEQKPFKTQYTVDVSFNKSWRLNDQYKLFKRNTFIILNVGINNVTNNKNLIAGGFEQLRFDFLDKRVDKFAPRLNYGFGTSYFISLTLRLN